MVVIEAIDVDDETGRPVVKARYVGDNEPTFDLFPSADGRLPVVGEQTPVLGNGADPVLTSGRQQVEGEFTSAGGFDPDADESWGLYADGILRCLGAVIEGTVIAREFRTRADFTIEGGLQIDSEAYNRLLFRRPGPLEDHPARIWSEAVGDDTWLRIEGVPGTAGFTPALNLRTLDDGTIYVSLDCADGLLAIYGSDRVIIASDDVVEISGSAITANGEYVTRVGCKLRNATGSTVTPSTATPLLSDVTDWNDVIPGTATQCVAFVSPTSYRPLIPGRWEARFAAGINPEADGPYPLAVGFRLNGGAVQRLNQVNTVNNAITGGGAVECSNTYAFNGTTDRIEFIVSHGDASNKTVFGPVMEFTYKGPA